MADRRSLFKRLIATVVLAGCAALGGAHAAQGVSPKIAADLASSLTATTAPAVTWARMLNGQLHVKVVMVSNSDDPTLATLRADILARGGSVSYVYVSVRAL